MSGHIDVLSRFPQIPFTFLGTPSLVFGAFVSNRCFPWDTGAILPHSADSWLSPGVYNALGGPLFMMNWSEESEHSAPLP